MKPLKNKWVCLANEEDIERAVVFLEVSGYTVWGSFKKQRSLRNTFGKIFVGFSHGAHESGVVLRMTPEGIQEFDCPPTHRFNNVDEMIAFHFKQAEKENK